MTINFTQLPIAPIKKYAILVEHQGSFREHSRNPMTMERRDSGNPISLGS